ncbi:MAG: membrane protein insertion efficiency factor YidD [Candidatus Moraniibacteriota bacterium]
MVKKIVLWSIRWYQKVLSPDQGWFSVFFLEKWCRFYPTCSQYTYLCVERFGVWRGMWLGLRRIVRCHPWNPGGFDLPPETEKH